MFMRFLCVLYECFLLNVCTVFFYEFFYMHVCFPLQALDRFLYLFEILWVFWALRIVQGVHTKVIEILGEVGARSAFRTLS
jgi:hypothetical protein